VGRVEDGAILCHGRKPRLSPATDASLRQRPMVFCSAWSNDRHISGRVAAGAGDFTLGAGRPPSETTFLAIS
jgi:hypothetical protein